MIEGALAVAGGVCLVVYAVWRWRTPFAPSTLVAWRLFGAKYEERPESFIDRADRKIRWSALPGICGGLLVVSGLTQIVTKL